MDLFKRYEKYLDLKLKLIEDKPGKLYASIEEREKTIKEFLEERVGKKAPKDSK